MNSRSSLSGGNTKTASSLWTAYQIEINAGRLRVDDAQAAAVRALDDLFTRSISHAQSSSPRSPSSSPRRRGSGKDVFSFMSCLYLKAMGRIPACAGMTMGSAGMTASGVYLHGPVGRGKTAMMDLFFKTLPNSIPKRRVHFHAFMLDVQAFLHDLRRAGTHGVDDALPKFAAHVAQTARVLCFDEFHVRDVADAMILARLFTALFASGVVVVMTSNVAPDDLYEGGLQRDLFLPFINLIKSKMQVVTVAGPHDYRTDRVAGRPVYFSPLSPGADAAMDTMFRDLTDTEPSAAPSDTLTVLGHSVTIPNAAHGVARARFSDLCEKPLAAQDYLAIAAAYSTVMIDHVPRLTYDRRNETKRFIILVDILYEHRRRLILSADAPLDRLFVDNEHAFEFARTLSRLQEMASAGYVAP